MAYTPEQVQFLVPKLSTGNSPFSLALMRQQSALASVHTGDRDPYDPFNPNIEQTGANQPFSDIELASGNFQGPQASGNSQLDAYAGDTAPNSFISPADDDNRALSESTTSSEGNAAPVAEQRIPNETTPPPENNFLNPSTNSSAANPSFGGGGSSGSPEISSISATQADTPTLDITATTSGTEDSPIALDIDAGLTDASETLSVTISNIPDGATLSAGTVNPDGTVTLTADELDDLTITPPENFSGSFDLDVTATSTDGDTSASITDTISVSVEGQADTPTLDITATTSGTEDSPIALDIDAGLTDAGEVLSVTISNIPDGATLSAGTVNPDGTVTLTADELDGLTITPPENFSGSFGLDVTATSTDGDTSASITDTISVSVEGQADTPTLDITATTSGTEDSPITLDIDGGLTDSGEVLSVTVSNIPEGATLSAGTVNPDGTVTLTADELDGLTITPPADYNGSFDLGVTATSTDGTDTATTSDTLSVSVEAEADAPTLDVTDASGIEDSPIPLDIDAGLTDAGEVLSITVSNIPEGATLSAGTVNPDGTVTLTADELDGLTITPPADYSGSFDLGVTATSADGTDTASVSDTLTVDVTGEADAPTLDVTDAAGTEDSPIALDIDAGLTDSGEVLSVTVSNIPDGATLSAGTVN
uniref:beta strand repeat-containing protein n=1 Tax=Thalassospira australica TaxID=1528106 RepID=UPI00051A11D2